MKPNNPDEIAAAALELARNTNVPYDRDIDALRVQRMSNPAFIRLLHDAHNELRTFHLEVERRDIGEFNPPDDSEIPKLRRELIRIMRG